MVILVVFFFSSRRRHTRLQGDWSSDVCSSDLSHSRVNVPAVVIEFHRAVFDHPLDILDRLLLNVLQTYNDVGYLDARIVDVILDLDVAACRLKDPDKRVPDRSIPQVPDVSRLVGIDIRVLDDHLTPLRGKSAHTATSKG